MTELAAPTLFDDLEARCPWCGEPESGPAGQVGNRVCNRPTHRSAEQSEDLGHVGMDEAESAARVEGWIAMATAWVASLPAGTELHADSLTAAVGLPSFGPDRNNVLGAFFRSQAHAGRIEDTGRVRASERVARRGSKSTVWRKR